MVYLPEQAFCRLKNKTVWVAVRSNGYFCVGHLLGLRFFPEDPQEESLDLSPERFDGVQTT